MKRSKKLKILLPGLFIIALLFPIATSAYSGSYTFTMSAAVLGKTKHNLANKATTTTAKGTTYDIDGKVTTSSTFSVQLHNNWFTAYTVTGFTANNWNYTKSFGTVKKDGYVINVTKTKAGKAGDYIKGNGTINQ
ncbi:hypothetical protein [Ornithinibacillus bavariensis]|uniref:Uncharacterized protein n=1 Tax=Ornithinibacillus bavariensis TaxID=545502 RepID=A0A920C664_9BACI|nr:hypothetical protein [Ornithinibacillus bavariensis]GIO27460.1 hypothetical protein J43TS3_20710 [Ornithinibacillus bavariensis]